MKKVLIVGLVLLATAGLLPLAAQQDVRAEAIGSANLRAGAGTNFDVVGEISAGTSYRVVSRHALVPWLLLEVPEIPTGAGWVFADLVQITQGNLDAVPLVDTFDELPAVPATPTPIISANTTGNTPTAAIGATSTPPPPPPSLVTATLTGRSNVRFGPGIDYPIMLTLDAGSILTVIARHSTFPWYQVAVEAANGEGWVSDTVVEISGDLNQLPVISDLNIPFPSPSPTPDSVISVESPFSVDFGISSPALIAQLGEPVHNFLLSQGISPRSDREASLFVMDLSTGEHFVLNGGVAYSGTSINKISVLVAYFVYRDVPLQEEDARLLANTMVCSENTTTNAIMTEVGEGDILLGGERVSALLSDLGLGNSYVVSPFDIGLPNPTPVPVQSRVTEADQTRTEPDPFNQITIEEMGWLLGSMYQCAADGTGPLSSAFPEQITQHECRQMTRVMSANRIGRLIEAGVGTDAVVAHKHGWVEAIYNGQPGMVFGDAGIVFGVDNDYVLAMIYRERVRRTFEASFPVMEEVSRQVWNHFNPSAPLQVVGSDPVPAECNIAADPVIVDLLVPELRLPGE